MFKFFKNKLEAKLVFFALNKLMVEITYRLSKYSEDDERHTITSEDAKSKLCFNEATAVSFFVTSQAVHAAKVDTPISIYITSLLKGYCMAFLKDLDKEQQQQFIDERYKLYQNTLGPGFDEGAVCSVFLNLLSIKHNETDILQNFAYTSLLSLIFTNGAKIVSSANRDFRLVQGEKISSLEWKEHFEDLKSVRSNKDEGKTNKQQKNKTELIEKYKAFSDELKQQGTFEDQISKGYGPFGLTKTNPIPTTSTTASTEYLNQLILENGNPITYRRLGSTAAPDVTDGMIDMFEISVHGEKLATLYLCPYHNKVSAKVPDGFTKKSPQ